jgi:NADPH-dependent 2,4-dienoyl-CoA reductase/sulfur reductase-like enzyme/flavorubredoxin
MYATVNLKYLWNMWGKEFMVKINKLQIRNELWQINAIENGRAYSSYLIDGDEDCAVIGIVPKQCIEGWINAIRELIGSAVKKILRYIVIFDAVSARESMSDLHSAFPEASLVADANTCYELEGASATVFGKKIEIRGSRILGIGKNKLTCISRSGMGGHSFWVATSNEEYFVKCDSGVERVFEEPQLVDTAITKKHRKARSQCKKVFVPYVKELYISELTGAVCKGLQESFETGEVEIETMPIDVSNIATAVKKIHLADAIIVGSAVKDGEMSKVIRELMSAVSPGDLNHKKASFYATLPGTGHNADAIGYKLIQLGANVLDSGFMNVGRLEMQDLRNAEEYAFNLGCMLQQKPNPRGSQLVKCIVCGEIFDSSLAICPVCGAGLEQCVPVSEDEIKYKICTGRRYLILGGGTAAVNAADSIRQRDTGGKIMIITEEPYLPVNRPMLTKDIDASVNADLITLHSADWYEEKQITVLTGVSAKKIDIIENTVELSNGEKVNYDKLIYALGSECFVPPFEGSKKEGVVTIRHIADVQKMMDLLSCARNAVIIGGGVLGLEAAYEIWRRGIHVTVLEATPQFIGRSVSADTAKTVQKQMERMGVDCYTAVNIAGIEGDSHVNSVRLADGTIFPADLVIISCGSRANIDLAREAGIETQRAVVVNAKMETNIPDIYACGDCAELNGIDYQLWSEASAQGKAAGANAVGETILCTNIPAGLSLDAFGMQLFSIGDVGKTEGKTYKIVNTKDEVRGKQLTYWFSEGVLTGATAIGYPERTDELQNAVLTKTSYGELF